MENTENTRIKAKASLGIRILGGTCAFRSLRSEATGQRTSGGAVELY